MGNVQATAAVGGAAAAAAIVIVQTAALFHVTISAEYAVAVVALISPLIHWVSANYGVKV